MVYCPHCGSDNIETLDAESIPENTVYLCYDCGDTFSDYDFLKEGR